MGQCSGMLSGGNYVVGDDSAECMLYRIPSELYTFIS